MSGLSLLGLTVLELKSPVFGQGFFSLRMNTKSLDLGRYYDYNIAQR